ncbi:hypothetical protein Ciccas_013064 [Cichlidogyrus casuarinus]|uniref:Uncharacterized protein n=1 Tax=Cichlidogyrus casuarinus TaxID=1844966 RepID=A0ABD2PRN2_9PLAT
MHHTENWNLSTFACEPHPRKMQSITPQIVLDLPSEEERIRNGHSALIPVIHEEDTFSSGSKDSLTGDPRGLLPIYRPSIESQDSNKYHIPINSSLVSGTNKVKPKPKYPVFEDDGDIFRLLRESDVALNERRYRRRVHRERVEKEAIKSQLSPLVSSE